MGEREAVVAFLDFDGVISTPRAMLATGRWIDPVACHLLVKLQERHGFSIVVSSTWRLLKDRARIVLAEYGLDHHLHSDWRTNESPTGMRGEEVDDWLRRNGEPEFIIFDDERFDFNERHIARLIQTDMINGMLDQHYHEADRLLGRICGSHSVDIHNEG